MVAGLQDINGVNVLGPQPGPQQAFLESSADIAIYGGAAGGGKMLSIDTPIPTPRGFVPMGEVRPGDTVFGLHGQAEIVLAESEVLTVPAWRLLFEDGSTVIAHDDHLWLTYTAADLSALTRRDPTWRAARRAQRPSKVGGRKSGVFTAAIRARNAQAPTPSLDPPTGSVRTTAEIVATLRTARGRANHAIPVADAIVLTTQDLPLDPYVLGCWLGDGSATAGAITSMDQEIVDAVVAAGFPITSVQRKQDNRASTYHFRTLRPILRALGVWGAKHIPHAYLWASADQRLALLAGLLDTDGTIDKSGGVDFVNTNRALTEGVAHLARSLGYKAAVREGRARLKGVDCGPAWRVTFTATGRVFRLSRKAALLPTTSRRTTRFRYIVGAERTDPLPMKCIQITGPEHLYLAGESFIPTHNSYALLLEPLHYVDKPGFTAVFFRTLRPELTNPGGLWPASRGLYSHIPGAHPRNTVLDWTFPGGAVIKFASLQYDDAVYSWKGSEICFLAFDELTGFSETAFWYMLSRNRSSCGVQPYVRATTNPDADSWVADLIAWWIDQDTGFPIKERSGVLRYFFRVGDRMIWGDTPQEVKELTAPLVPPPDDENDPLADRSDPYRHILVKSFTFIPAMLSDNPALTSKDPAYRSNLMSLPLVERERLLSGNWKVRAGAGKVFKREWWQPYTPADFWDESDPSTTGFDTVIQSWDTAYSEKETNAFSVCATWGALGNNYYLMDLQRGHWDFPTLLEEAETLAKKWKPNAVLIENKASGPSLIQSLHRRTKAPVITINIRPNDDKVKRAHNVSPLVESGHVFLPVGSVFVSAFIEEHAGFPDVKFRDQVDTTSMALTRLSGGRLGVAEYTTDDVPTGAGAAIGEDALPITPSHRLPKVSEAEIKEHDLNQYLQHAPPTPVAPLDALDFSAATLG